jgi:hypothetical protein
MSIDLRHSLIKFRDNRWSQLQQQLQFVGD